MDRVNLDNPAIHRYILVWIKDSRHLRMNKEMNLWNGKFF